MNNNATVCCTLETLGAAERLCALLSQENVTVWIQSMG